MLAKEKEYFKDLPVTRHVAYAMGFVDGATKAGAAMRGEHLIALAREFADKTLGPEPKKAAK
jgi:hypothetical protein